MKKIVVFIPSYNEERTLGNIIKKIRDFYKNSQQKGYKIEMIVVDDGSKDKTPLIAKQLNVHFVTHPKNLGLGAATRSGMQTAYEMGADIAVKIDADFQHDPIDIEKVIMPIIKDKADCVFGSRFVKQGVQYKMPLYRKAGNSFFSFLTSLFTGLKITDGQTGLMAFSKRYLKIFEMFSDYNETQQLIIDSWRKKMRVIEVPVIFHKRIAGKSFISLKYPFKVIPNIIRLFIHSFPLKIFAIIGSLIILLGIILAYFVLSNKITFIGDATIAILIIAGIQFIFFGFIADMISKRRM